MTNPFQKQEGGKHYKEMKIQPAEYIHKNNIGYMEGRAIYYLSRWKNKNGVEDLKKAIHMIELLIEMESTFVFGKESPDKIKCDDTKNLTAPANQHRKYSIYPVYKIRIKK
jgi:hypothetical protein